MAIKGGFDANDIAAQILSALDAVEDTGVKKAEDIGVSIGQAVRDGIVDGSKGLESEIGKTYKQFQNFVRSMNRSVDGLKLDKWKKGLGLAESLMKDEKYARRVADALKDVQATFNGTKVTGLENVLKEFAKNSKALQGVSVPQVKSGGAKTSNKPKVETPVVQADPTPVVKAEEKKQEAIENTTANLHEQSDAAKSIVEKTKEIESAYEAANKKVERLRNNLAEAQKEQEKLTKHAELYGYTSEMSPRKAGQVYNNIKNRKGSASNGDIDGVIRRMVSGRYDHASQMSNGDYWVTNSKGYGTQVNKSQYDFIQYLFKEIAKLNVGWEDGLKILASQNGELDKANQKVARLSAELETAEQEKESAYERMSYAHAGIFGDEAIEADKIKRSTAATEKQTEALQQQASAAESAAKAQKKLNEQIMKYVPKSKKNAIADAYKDDDGYWITLQEGWEASNTDSGARTIHSDTISDLRYQIAGITQQKEQTEALNEQEDVRKAIARLNELNQDPYNIKDEKEVNRIYQERLAIIKQIGEEKFKSYSEDEYEGVQNVNQEYKSRLTGFAEARDNDIYDEIWNRAFYDNEQIQSAQELEQLLEKRLGLLQKISLKDSDTYNEELEENKLIEDRIALMKKLEPLVASGAISKNDLEEIVFENGTLGERVDTLNAIQMNAGKAFDETWDDALQDAQMFLDTYEKILVTTASGKKLELGPDMSMEDYRAFLRMDTESAKSIEFVRKQTQALQEQKSAADSAAEAQEKLQKAYLATRKVYEVKDGNGLTQIFPTREKANALVANVRGLGGKMSDPVEKYLGQVDEQLRESFERIYYQPSAVYKPGKEFELVDGDIDTYIAMIEGLDAFKSQYARLQRLRQSGARSIKIRPNQNMLDNFDFLLNESNYTSDDAIELLERILTQRLSSVDVLSSLLNNGRSDLQGIGAKPDPNSTWADMARYYDSDGQMKFADAVESTAHAKIEDATATEKQAQAQEKLNAQMQEAKKPSQQLFDTESGQLAFIEGVKESIKVENELQEELKETNAVLEGQISMEEHLSKQQIEADKLQLEAEQFVARCKEIQNQEVFDGIDCDKLISELSTVLTKLKEVAEQRDITFGAYDPEWAFEGVKSHLESRKRISEALKEGVVYHAGVLGDIGHTMKSIPLGNVEPHRYADRTFNGFTGLYTTEDVDGFWANEWEGAPISTIDISHYKLFDAKNNELAGKAQDFFNNLNSTIYGYHNFFDHESGEMKTSTDVKSVEELYDDFKEVFKGIDLDFESFRNFVTRSKAIVEGHSFETIETPDLDQGITKSYSSAVLQGVSQDVFNSDSFQTQLLKMLGFEGIDLRSTKFNGTYTGGTVIFDVKPESIKATDEKWSDVMARHGYEIDEASLAREEKRRQLAFDTAKAYSQQADTAKEVIQLTDNYNSELDESNNKLMQGTKLVNEQGQIIRLFHNSDSVFDKFTGDNMSESNMLGKGHYLSFDQEQYQSYGKYQTQWYANVQKMFDANAHHGMSTDDATKIIETYCTDAVESFCKRMFNELTSGSASDSLSAAMQIAEAYNVDISDVFKTAGYDSVRINDEINIFDPSKIYRANDSVLQHDNSDKNAEEIKRINAERAKQLQEFVKASESMFSGELTLEESSIMTEILNKISIEGMSAADAVQELSNALKTLHDQQGALETVRIKKEQDGQVEARAKELNTFMTSELIGIANGILPDEDKTSLISDFSNKIMSGAITANEALNELYHTLEKIAEQRVDNDFIDDFGLDSEQVAETASQLQKLSSVDVTRIFDSVDLKEFLKALNIDKSHFATFKTLFEELMQITKAMGDGVDVGNAFDVKMAEITDTIMRLGGHMVNLDDSNYTDMMQQFYRHMSKTKVQFTDHIKSEYTKDQWKSLYNANKYYLTSDMTKGIAADSLYQELHELWPALFPENLGQQEDFGRIIEKLDEARQLKENNWKILQGFVSSDRDSIQGNVDDLYEKMSDALFAGKEIETVKVESNVNKNLDNIRQVAEEQSIDLEQKTVAAEQATDGLNKAFQNVKNASSRAVLKGATKADFEDFAKQIADDSGMELGTVAVARDEMNQMQIASIKLLNKELAQSITYTYDIQENAEGINEAFLRSSYAVGDANRALENARKKEEQDAKKKLQNDTWLYAQRGKLDTQQRRYTDPDRGIDGKLSIMSTETSLTDDAEPTIESLANHIRENIKKSLSDGLTDEVKRKIISDIEILENEIKVRQSETYSSTTMKSSQFETNKKAYQEYMKAFTARAQKSGVFPQMEKTISDLNAELNSVSDAKGFSQFVDNFKIARNKFQAETAALARDTKALQTQLSTLKGEENAYGKISANVRSIGPDNLGDSFKQKIASYESSLRDLRAAMDALKSDPVDTSGNLHRAFDDAALKAKNARIEIEGIFKESQKLDQISKNTLIDTHILNPSELQNLKAAMISFAASVKDGEFQFKGFNKSGTEMYGTLKQSSGAIKDVTVALKSSSDELYMYGTNASKASNEWNDFSTALSNGAKNLVGMYVGFQEGVQAVRTGLNYVKEIDLAMTELKKVTDETDASYKQFLNDAGSTSAIIGSTISDFTEASATFARLGYSMEESSSMAETAIIYKNVADGLDSVEESSDSIISTMMAFGIETNDTMSIIDRFNAVGNNFAITSAGIGEALQRSASALFAAGNTIDESVALVTAANSVIQNPEQVGTALKTLALRLRGAKTELEEAGLETDNMAESTSTLQAKLNALTHGKVDIMLDADTFKSTTQILREMSDAWEDMTDIERAAALELMGGKRQANILSSVIQNFETVEDVIETSMNSSGSAIAENEKWLDSIEGKTYQFTNALQTMWSNMLDSEVVKGFIGFGTEAIQFLDTSVGKVIALVAALKLIAKFKGFSIGGIVQGLRDTINKITTAQQTLQTLSQTTPIGSGYDLTNINAYAQAVSNLTAKQQANLLASQGLNQEQIRYALTLNQVDDAAMREAMAHVHAASAKDQEVVSGNKLIQQKALEVAASLKVQAAKDGETRSTELNAAADILEQATSEDLTRDKLVEIMTSKGISSATQAEILAKLGLTNANKGLAASIKALYVLNPVGFWITVGSTILSLIPILGEVVGAFTKSAEEIKQEAQEISQAYEDTANEVNDNLQSLGVTNDSASISALEKEFAILTNGVDKYGNNLSLTSDQYERYKDICEQIVGINPKIAEGYNSATKAIGNNAGALSQLIELQKTQQRNAVKDLISDKNLDTLASATFTNIDEYKKDNPLPYGDSKSKFSSAFASAISGLDDYEIYKALGFDGYDWNNYSGAADDSIYAQNFASDFYTQIVEELKDKESVLYDYLTTSEIDNLLDIASEHDKNLERYNNKINGFKDSLIDTLLQVPYGEEAYDKLDDSSKGFIAEWIKNSEIFKIDPDASEDAMQTQLKDNAATIQNLVNTLADENIQTAVSALEDLDESSLTAREHLDSIRNVASTIWESIGGEQNEYGFASKADIEKMLGIDVDAELAAWNDAITSIQGYLGDKISASGSFNYHTMTRQEMNAFLGIDWDAIGAENIKSVADVWERIRAAIGAHGSVQTYSTLLENVTSYDDILSQTKEIVSDNTEVTQEYKDALLELGITEEELSECFDENNGLVVKNSKQLNKLVKSAKKNVAENIKLAKSQARLEYYDLYKQMRDFTRGLDYTAEGYAILTDEQLAQIDSLYAEMDAINSAIARFSMLEAQLLGVTNAYTKFADAQTADEDNEYSAQAESMVEAFANALNTGDLGTEAAREAMLGLVPEEVYKNLDTVEEKLDAIAKYFNTGELSKYFSIDFDKEGNVEKVDITRDDLKQFFKAGKEKGVFTGNWEHFDLSEDITSLKQFANEMNITEEVAFALFEALENHDAGNLFDPSNILDKFMSGNIEYQAYNNAKAMAELQYQLANGTISAEEYAKKMVGLDGQLAAGAITQDEYKTAVANLKKQLEDGTITQQEYNTAVLGLANQQDKIAEDAYNQATAYYDKSKALEECNKKLKEYSDLLSDEDGLDKDGNPIDKEQVEKDIEAVSKEIQELMADLELLGEPTEMTISLASDYVQEQIDDVENSIKELANNESDILVKINTKFEEVQNSDFDLSQFGLSKDSGGNWTGVAEFITSMGLNPEDQGTMDAVTNYINLVDKQHTLNLLMGPETTSVLDTLTDIHNTLKDIATRLGVDYTLDVKTNLDDSQVTSFLDKPLSKTISVSIKKVGDWLSGLFVNGTVHANGTAHARGTAYASGSWGAPKTETALVGEVGTELLVRGDRWTTVGENGAEFTQVRKGDIIFNHKQTKQLLENGHVTGRGKLKGGSAFASGTAYNGIYTYDKYRNKEKTAYQGSTVASSLSKAAKDISKASDKLSDDFKEIFDWIEVRIEEITGALDVRGAKLENAVGFKKQNAVVDDMIELNQKLYNNLTAGASKYYEYASKLLAKVPSEYRKAAQDGSIAIESFVGKVGESTLEAIQDYREWVQKGDDATQQAEETLTEISTLAKQAIDNISQDYENKTSLRDNKIDQYEAYNSLLETDVGFESASVYQAMIKENNKNIATLEKQRDKMQEELNKRVESGEIKKYSQDWYDAVNDIAAVDTEIIELKTDTENWQDAINQLHWDKFDALMSRLASVSEEAENLIDILSNEKMVDDSGNWTDEGITALGLYAQQMEAAEVQAKKYEEEIDYLNKNWQKLGYTEEEYLEKLGELKDGQYEAIQAYHDSKDAIVDLNKERIDAIKEGIEKEIEAYEELIEAKKEELDAEKDLYDFQKSVMEQEKDIADIQRQLAALSGDNSASARAKRAQLEAELAEAQAALEESYYERSVSNQQEALDKELENFQDEKNSEMEGWDEYLENTEQVVADSLSTVQANTEAVYATLQAMGQEYGLSITESLTSPWREGETAIQSFSEQFGISISATVEELQELELEFLSTMAEIEQAGIDAANAVKENAQGYTEAEYKEPEKKEDKNKNDGDKKQEEKTIKVGGKINAQGAKIYDYVGDKSGAKQYYSKDPIYVVLDEKGGYLKVRHHKSKSGVTGWFKKSDVKAYAKGSMGVSKDQWALIDELGDELQLIPGKNGRLEYVKKGTGIVPADLTERLVNLAMDPQEMLDRNRPSIGVHPEIHHTEISIDNSIGELIHIDHCDQGTLPDVKKIVNDALEKHTQKLNQSLRKFAR